MPIFSLMHIRPIRMTLVEKVQEIKFPVYSKLPFMKYKFLILSNLISCIASSSLLRSILSYHHAISSVFCITCVCKMHLSRSLTMLLLYAFHHFIKWFHAEPSEFSIQFLPKVQSISKLFEFSSVNGVEDPILIIWIGPVKQWLCLPRTSISRISSECENGGVGNMLATYQQY